MFPGSRLLISSRAELVWEHDDDEYEGDPWQLAKSVGVNILSNKEFRAGFVVDGHLVAALFDASDRDGYEFDIAVAKDWQRKGLGKELMDIAFDIYRENAEAFGDDYTLNLDAINPIAARMLKQRGLVEVGRERGHILMSKKGSWSGQRWKPGQRQKRQRGKAKQQSRAYYRRNRAKILTKQKRRRSRGSWKNNPNRIRSEKRRQKQNRRRRASLQDQVMCPECLASLYQERLSAAVVLARFLEGDAPQFAPPLQRGGENGQPQRRQTPNQKLTDKREYRGNRGRAKLRSKRYYHTKCKRNPKCMKRRELYRENPKRYKRRAPKPSAKKASVLTVPDIAFVIGSAQTLGYVHSISSMSGAVNFSLVDPNTSPMDSLPVAVFLRAATLLSDEDTEAFFNLVDVEIGLDAYEDLTEEEFNECARLQGEDPTSDEFKSRCLEVLGDLDFANMDGAQFDVLDSVLWGEGDEDVRDIEDALDGNDTIVDTYDPHLFYGEVEIPKTRPTVSTLRSILAVEGLIASRGSRIGSVTGYAGYDTKFGSSLELYLQGGQVELVVGQWSQIGGMDSMYGAGPTEYRSKGKIKADPRLLTTAIKSIMKKDSFLQTVPQKDFRWHLGVRGEKPPVGLTIAAATAVLDSWTMEADVWRSVYIKKEVKPTGGPFSLDRSSTLKDMLAQLEANGHPAKLDTRNVIGSPRQVLELKNGRLVKQLLKLLEASADKMYKSQTDSGWDAFSFDFGGKQFTVTKRYFGYPVNGMKWVVQERY